MDCHQVRDIEEIIPRDNTELVDKAMIQDTLIVQVKESVPKNEPQKHRRENDSKGRKVFVGGLHSISEDEFKKHFERFGRITDSVVVHDSQTGLSRGFGFVTFDSEQSVENVLMKTFHELNGKQVEVKRAVPKCQNGKEASMKENPPCYRLPGGATSPWFNNSDGSYVNALSTYGWYLMDGYGYAIPYDPYHNLWYVRPTYVWAPTTSMLTPPRR